VVFTDPTKVEMACSQILQCAAASEFDVLVYCFMPDHIHLLVEGQNEHASLHRFVHSAKMRSGYAHARRFGQRLWQPGYHDRVARRREDVAELTADILENPVRAGPTRSAAEYPFSGSGMYTTMQLFEYVGTQRGRPGVM